MNRYLIWLQYVDHATKNYMSSKMTYNLLQKSFDIQCDLFIKGHIDYHDFYNLEYEYLKRKELFTINLN